ncbi:RNA polymerase sigma factor [Frigoriglobus tundricola]|uniref:RNA polymerase sigma-70 ECF-like HTH domain-containing protein n=1 Tax=Frigoriglobus tundricola TaxID=2774151 RepID=A0A6M5YQW3_9BACT|nr:sigma-70 family RNA polymerase sigma factor [Frigoriglobus tundricola]QJW95382.1 hypothetical protein FTUN_2931 [Frigoriglobus tundricola]
MPLGDMSFDEVIEYLQKGKGHGPDPGTENATAEAAAKAEAAASEVFHRFATRLTAVAATKLTDPIRLRVGPEDIVQSVFRSFFRRFADGQFKAGGWEALWAILVVIAVRKCWKRSAGHRADRRDVGREVSDPDSSGSPPGWGAVSREPTPEEAAELADLVDYLTARLSVKDQQIFKMRLEEFSPTEIAAAVGLPQATVFRRLASLRDKVKAMWEE